MSLVLSEIVVDETYNSFAAVLCRVDPSKLEQAYRLSAFCETDPLRNEEHLIQLLSNLPDDERRAKIIEASGLPKDKVPPIPEIKDKSTIDITMLQKKNPYVATVNIPPDVIRDTSRHYSIRDFYMEYEIANNAELTPDLINVWSQTFHSDGNDFGTRLLCDAVFSYLFTEILNYDLFPNPRPTYDTTSLLQFLQNNSSKIKAVAPHLIHIAQAYLQTVQNILLVSPLAEEKEF